MIEVRFAVCLWCHRRSNQAISWLKA